MLIFEWIIWSVFAFLTIFLCSMWFFKKKEYKKGELYDTGEVATLIGLPWILFIEGLVLITFLFIGFNKLNLLWIYPLVYWGGLFTVTINLHKKGNVR
nr:hypothetical protein 6 [bacterium]